jgi:hypothetical protein
MTDTAPLTSLLTTYILASQQFQEDDVYDSLKEEYSDICSHGDVVINDILDVIHDNYHSSPETLLSLLEKVDDAARFAPFVHSTISYWIEKKHMDPNPFWAS